MGPWVRACAQVQGRAPASVPAGARAAACNPALAVLAAVLALGAGCGGSDAAEEPVLRLGEAAAGGRFGDASPGPGRVVLAFAEAARRGDAAQLWALLSTPTRASTGPTPEAFAGGTAESLAEVFADFRRARVLLSRRLPGGWGVGAVVGRYEPEDGDPQPAAFAAALRREPAGWRVELGAVHIARLEPAPLAETEGRPQLGAEAEAGGEIQSMLLWVDTRPVDHVPLRTGPFTAELRGRLDRALEAGPHAVVVFAASPDAAGALAWPFEVER